MFYEERVIGEVLCWRSTPNGEWKEKTLEELTKMLVAAQKEITWLHEQAAGASL